MMKLRKDEEEDEDRISQLHQPLLHHILCYLSQKEAVQTCVLSKSWRHLGPTRPKVEFRREFFFGNEEGKYVSILEKTFQRYHEQKLPIQEFIIVGMKEGSKSYSLLQEWVPVVLSGAHKFHLSIDSAKKDSEFHLSIDSAYEDPESARSLFRLPLELLKAEFLTELVLKNCQIDSLADDRKFLCKHLRKLRLDFVYITDATLEKITSSCPLIECLNIYSCKGLQTIKLTKAHNLKVFEFIVITSNCPSWIHNPSMYFPSLKKLYLFKVRLSDESIDKFSTNYFPCLENLFLSFVSDSERFQLSIRSIKHLAIVVEGSSFKAAKIDAPNIRCFDFSCDILPSISFTTTSDQWKSRVCVSSKLYSSSWFRRLSEICKALSTSQISLDLIDIPKVVPDDCGDVYQPLVIENLSLKGNACSSVQDLWNGFFRYCRPRNIQQTWHADRLSFINEKRENQLIELLCKILLSKSEKGWQQNLDNVKMEASYENKGEWRGVEGTSSLSEIALPWDRLNICFRLKWRME